MTLASLAPQAAPSGEIGPLHCWQAFVRRLLVFPCTFSQSSYTSHKHLRRQRQQPSALDLCRWTRLHDVQAEQQAALCQRREKMLCEPPPYELTLLYQHRRMEVLETERWEKRMQSRWNRMLLTLLEAQRRRTRRDALHEVPALRAERRRDAGALRATPYGGSFDIMSSSPHNRRNDSAALSSYREGAEDEAPLAAQLGLDMATYRLLRQLEGREIMPEDYDLLGMLDGGVQLRTLNEEDLHCFEIVTYALPRMTTHVPLTEFAIDYWRVPLATLACEMSGDFGVNFWKLPLATLPENLSSDDLALRSVDVCGVCLVDFDDGDKLRVLPCDHHFHMECIDHWLLASSTVCPVDRQDVQYAGRNL